MRGNGSKKTQEVNEKMAELEKLPGEAQEEAAEDEEKAQDAAKVAGWWS